MHADFPTARIKPKERMSDVDKPSMTNRPNRPVTEKKVTHGLTIGLTADTDNLAAKLRAISKHTQALADELEEIDSEG